MQKGFVCELSEAVVAREKIKPTHHIPYSSVKISL